MSQPQIYITLAVFGAVIVAIAFDLVDMLVATLLGVSILMVTAILGEQDILAALRTGGGPLSLLFGGMVVARTLAGTGIFDRVGAIYLRATRGDGKRFLLLLVALVAPLCAFLPNATTVILLAPIVVRVTTALELDIVGPLIVTAIVSNSSGLLTLVGDPATFLVGSSIGMTFGQYLRTVSLGGLLSIIVLVLLLPALMPSLWRVRRTLPPEEPPRPLQHPWFAVLALAVLALMLLLFVFGESLPVAIGPPAVSILAASLALLLIYCAKVESVDAVVRDIDWKTLVFLGGIFCLVQAMTKTGLLQGMVVKLHNWVGTDLTLVSLGLIAGIALLSSVLANIPVVAASLLMVRGYLVAAAAVPEAAMGRHFTDWPPAVLPVFVAMMFGATLGGNATLIGASANIVTAGICAQNGRRVTFGQWLRYGVPLTVGQLALAAVYVLALLRLARER